MEATNWRRAWGWAQRTILGVGFLALSFLFAGAASAAVNPPIAPTSTDNITTQAARYNWTWNSGGGGTESNWVVAKSTDGVNDTIVAVVASTTVNYTFAGLATNTKYYFAVWGEDGVASSTAAATSSPIYTHVDTPAVTAVTPVDPQTLAITINRATNPTANTYFVVKDTASGVKYLQADHTWGVATATLDWVQLNSGSATNTVGLATNTVHTISVAAVNGDSTNTSTYSSPVTAYTQVDDTAAVTAVTSASAQTLAVTVSRGTNPTSATYFVVKDTASGVKYLQADHTWGVATATLDWTELNTGSATTSVGLATNTLHTVSVATVNGDSTATSSYSSPLSLYTLATTPAAPAVVTSTAVNTLAITVNSATLNTNPTAATTFIVKDTGSGVKYLQTNGTWGTSTATLTYAQLGSGSATTTTGLTANTAHVISVAAVNGDNATTTYGATASSYTRANVPASLTRTTQNVTQLIIAWTGDGTTYYAENTTNSTNSGWTGGTSFDSGNLACGTTYSFRVMARNGDGVPTAYSDSSSFGTQLCASYSSGLPGGGGGGSTVTVAPTYQTYVNTTTAQTTTQTQTTQTTQTTQATQPSATVTTPASGSAAADVVVHPLLTGTNEFSSVTFVPVTKSGIVAPGKSVTFKYGYTNDTEGTQRLTVTRELINVKGKVVSKTTGTRTLKTGKGFDLKVTQAVPKTYAEGLYTVRIKILDTKTKAVVDQNSFSFKVEKPKKK